MHLKIAFVRRGFSGSGGAEAYLQRLAAGVVERGHEAALVTTPDWPAAAWPFGELVALPAGTTPLRFADAVERAQLSQRFDLVMSLERLWQCDVLRAGDGVHRAWLARRRRAGGLRERISLAVNGKHRGVLRLEEALFRAGGARRVIANSEMVKREIMAAYSTPAERISVVYNGTPVRQFAFSAEARARVRADLQLGEEEIALLFVGSGWERKGLRMAIAAVEHLADPRVRLLVAGKGNERAFASSAAVKFLGEVKDVSALDSAADLFVLPTLYDPFSNACLEALAAGLPVITTTGNGFSEIIEDGRHGSVLDEPTVQTLADSIALWLDKEKREAARTPNAARAAQFDISANVTQTLEILLQEAAMAESTSGKIRNT